MFGNKKSKELNEWNYVEEKKKEKEKEEGYIVSSEKKFRARALIITAVLCIAIVALGIVYVNKIIETTNAETVDNSQIIETSSTEVSSAPTKSTLQVPAAMVFTTAQNPSETKSITTSTATSQKEIWDSTTAIAEVDEGFTATASADENGLVVEWNYTNNEFAGKTLSIYMTDGLADYTLVGENIPIDVSRFTTDTDNAKDAVSLLIVIINSNDDAMLKRAIMVDNRTYEPEVTYSDDLDISSLFQ